MKHGRVADASVAIVELLTVARSSEHLLDSILCGLSCKDPRCSYKHALLCLFLVAQDLCQMFACCLGFVESVIDVVVVCTTSAVG